MVQKINDNNFEEIVEKSNNTFILDFYADWCGPCKHISPIIDELSETHKEISFGKIDVDESPKLSARFNVRNIPLILIFKENGIVDKIIGAVSKKSLEDKLNLINNI